MTTHTTRKIRDAINKAKTQDLEWMRRQDAGRDDPKFLPWMPFSWPEFISLLAEALPEMPGDRFLDVGCGPGTRMLLARDIFGLDVKGFDRVPAYVAAARENELFTTLEDALEYKSYGEFDFIWMNRPIRDQELQGRLEAKVWDEMSPGAVIGCANLDNRPPQHWYPVYDDWEIKRGVWQKP
jgi:trans-aconitate methyltransferase